jgi:uncharacterized membrane protein
MVKPLSRPAAVGTWAGLTFLVVVMVVFIVIRLTTDIPYLLDGDLPPEDDFARRYVEHPVLAYLHILPGLVYLLGAPFQLSRRFRNRHLSLHRGMGRVLIPAGIVSGGFAIAFGLLHAFGGRVEAAASLVFGAYFITALVTAYRAIRSGDQDRHRRWMIRAFAVGLAVGTIRIWIGFLEGVGLLTFEESFGLAFWISFVMHAAIAELWLWRRPA